MLVVMGGVDRMYLDGSPPAQPLAAMELVGCGGPQPLAPLPAPLMAPLATWVEGGQGVEDGLLVCGGARWGHATPYNLPKVVRSG